jgi:hypothetical protein
MNKILVNFKKERKYQKDSNLPNLSKQNIRAARNSARFVEILYLNIPALNASRKLVGSPASESTSKCGSVPA